MPTDPLPSYETPPPPFPGRVLPVVVLDDPALAPRLARALLDGGLGAMEVTFRTAAAAEAIRAVRAEVPEMVVGAGTVLTADHAREALQAGAAFAVAPGLNPAMVEHFQDAGVPFLPGVMTPSEVDRARRLGCTRIKWFPAGVAGGARALKAILAPFRGQGLDVCPTGGVSLDTLEGYLAQPEVFAVGGSWIATRDQVAGECWEAITAQAREAVARAG